MLSLVCRCRRCHPTISSHVQKQKFVVYNYIVKSLRAKVKTFAQIHSVDDKIRRLFYLVWGFSQKDLNYMKRSVYI